MTTKRISDRIYVADWIEEYGLDLDEEEVCASIDKSFAKFIADTVDAIDKIYGSDSKDTFELSLFGRILDCVTLVIPLEGWSDREVRLYEFDSGYDENECYLLFQVGTTPYGDANIGDLKLSANRDGAVNNESLDDIAFEIKASFRKMYRVAH